MVGILTSISLKLTIIVPIFWWIYAEVGAFPAIIVTAIILGGGRSKGARRTSDSDWHEYESSTSSYEDELFHRSEDHDIDSIYDPYSDPSSVEFQEAYGTDD